MLHHVRPGGGLQNGFAPNSGLEVTPEFLEAAILRARELGYDIISLDEAIIRIREAGEPRRPFAAFTLDDGYRDNLVHAWPVFRRQHCPFTIFVAPAITDGNCEIWWRGLEAVVAGDQRVKAEIDGFAVNLDAVSDAQKQQAFERLYWPVRNMPQHAQRIWIRHFCRSRGIDLDALCRAEAMTWDEIRMLSADHLCTIGAHTVHHYAIAKLSEDEAVAEAISSRDRIAQEIGKTPEIFAYPYGDEHSAGPRDFQLIAKAGFKAAVTTRKGVVFPAHKSHLTALPRVSLNGGFQKLRYLDVLLSGSAFAFWNRFRRVNAA